jgi:hypothetical protein
MSIVRKSLMVVTFLLCAQAAFSWGATGHRVTGQVADRYITKKARQRLERILGQESLAIVGNWMDEVRSDSSYDYMQDWHWVTIPEGMTYEQTIKNPNGDIIETLNRVTLALKSRTLSPEKEAEYLKVLIHLVGDIHMPLHVGSKDDRGGNDVKVTWFRSESNLHRVWDSEMIDDTRLSYTEFAASLDDPSASVIKSWQKSSVLDWAYESISYHKNVYTIGNGKLSYSYPYYNLHIVRKRLLMSGVRLAGLLNEIYG